MRTRSWAWVALLPIVLAAGQAEAGYRLCNRSHDTVEVAVGYYKAAADGGPNGQWMSEGWWVLPYAKCATLIQGAIKDLPTVYYHAQLENGAGDWGGSKSFCVKKSAFTIIGNQDCDFRGFSTAYFTEVDLSNRPFGDFYTTNLMPR